MWCIYLTWFHMLKTQDDQSFELNYLCQNRKGRNSLYVCTIMNLGIQPQFNPQPINTILFRITRNCILPRINLGISIIKCLIDCSRRTVQWIHLKTLELIYFPQDSSSAFI